jgi:undecaprenyl-diphosphatase
MNRAQSMIARFDLAEYRLCRELNRGAGRGGLGLLLRTASRLGDGVLWYVLMAALPLIYGAEALRPVVIMAATGLTGLLIYKALKKSLQRERPFIRHAGITLAMPPLDRYSFPSGHTLHAVCFTWQAVGHYPALAWILVPVSGLIAASRVVLGLHYPSDVVAGAVVGAVLGSVGMALA